MKKVVNNADKIDKSILRVYTGEHKAIMRVTDIVENLGYNVAYVPHSAIHYSEFPYYIETYYIKNPESYKEPVFTQSLEFLEYLLNSDITDLQVITCLEIKEDKKLAVRVLSKEDAKHAQNVLGLELR